MAFDFVKKTDAPPTGAALDRRRPKRRNDVSPELIPLLRATGSHGVLPPEGVDDSDPLAVSRGIARALLISAIAWPLIGLAVWVL